MCGKSFLPTLFCWSNKEGKEGKWKELKKEQEKLNILNSLLNLYTKLEVERVKWPPRFKCWIIFQCWAAVRNSNREAGVNQQPPVHQFRMRLFKPFWGWTQTHPARPAQAFLFSSSPAQGFFSPLPQSFPLLPTSLTLNHKPSPTLNLNSFFPLHSKRP